MASRIRPYSRRQYPSLQVLFCAIAMNQKARAVADKGPEVRHAIRVWELDTLFPEPAR
jgi:hypothetical protein